MYPISIGAISGIDTSDVSLQYGYAELVEVSWCHSPKCNQKPEYLVFTSIYTMLKLQDGNSNTATCIEAKNKSPFNDAKKNLHCTINQEEITKHFQFHHTSHFLKITTSHSQFEGGKAYKNKNSSIFIKNLTLNCEWCG